MGPTQKYDENILLVKTPSVRQNLVCYQDQMIDDLSEKARTTGVCQCNDSFTGLPRQSVFYDIF